MHLLHGLVLIIKTLNDIIDLTFDNFYEKHGDPLVWTVGCIVMAMKRYEIKDVFLQKYSKKGRKIPTL